MRKRFPVYIPRDSNRVLVAAWIICSTPLPRSVRDAVIVRVGIGQGTKTVSEAGVFDGTKEGLGAFEPRRITGPADLATTIPVNGAVFAEVELRGAVAGVSGLAVQIETEYAVAPPQSSVGDTALRDTTEDVTQHERQRGRETILVPITMPWAGVQAKQQHSSVNQEITVAGGVTAGLVSVTATKPTWATKGYAKVTAFASSASAAAAASGFQTTIYDGATDHGPQVATLPATAAIYSVAGSTFGGEITSTTTWTLRIQAFTNTIDVDRQSISLLMVWE